MSGQPAPVSAVIVAHNSAGFIAKCLEAATQRCQEVIVVDNASIDSTVPEVLKFQAVRLVVNDHNRGFAAAVNQGVRQARFDYILLLNPDAELLNPVEPLLAECRADNAGAAGGLLLSHSGEPQAGFTVRRFPTPAALAFEALGWNRIWPGNPVNRRYRASDLDLTAAQEVDQPAGAFLMFPRSVWQRVGGWDESFHPVWFEDVDFLKRVRNAGYFVRFQPNSRARHQGGHSVSQLSPQNRRTYWYASLLTYAAKHFSEFGTRVVAASVMAGLVLRWPAAKLTGLAGSGDGGKEQDYDKVIWLSARYIWLGPAAGQRASRHSIEANG
jgi:hypothetical protein